MRLTKRTEPQGQRRHSLLISNDKNHPNFQITNDKPQYVSVYPTYAFCITNITASGSSTSLTYFFVLKKFSGLDLLSWGGDWFIMIFNKWVILEFQPWIREYAMCFFWRSLAECHSVLSGSPASMQRRLSIAISFCGAPRIVFLDEPGHPLPTWFPPKYPQWKIFNRKHWRAKKIFFYSIGTLLCWMSVMKNNFPLIFFLSSEK